jgi:hypothetical protein
MCITVDEAPFGCSLYNFASNKFMGFLLVKGLMGILLNRRHRCSIRGGSILLVASFDASVVHNLVVLLVLMIS